MFEFKGKENRETHVLTLVYGQMLLRYFIMEVLPVEE